VTLLREWSALRSWSFNGLPTMSDPLIASMMLASVTGCESTWGGGFRFIFSPGGFNSKVEDDEVGTGQDGIFAHRSKKKHCHPNTEMQLTVLASACGKIISPSFSARCWAACSHLGM
jgi:hypothetical protein